MLMGGSNKSILGFGVMRRAAACGSLMHLTVKRKVKGRWIIGLVERWWELNCKEVMRRDAS